MLSDAKLIKVYCSYRNKLKNTRLESQNSRINFKDYLIPKSKNIKNFNIFIFESMVSDYTRELINSINRFRLYIKSIKTWQSVLKEFNNHDKSYIIIEFLIPLVDYCINRPYSIRNKFIFSLTHLLHQTRILTDSKWVDGNLPNDQTINYNTLLKVANNFVHIDDFQSQLNNINNQDFRNFTSEYRSRSHHRFSRNIELGYSLSFKRKKENEKNVVYYFGGEPAISISELIQPILHQHFDLINSFNSYWKVILEMFKIFPSDK